MVSDREQQKGGESMSAYDRRLNLLAELVSQRFVNCEDLASKFGVNIRTIYRDVELLMCSYPIETVQGRYGGVKVLDWFNPSSTSLAPQQFALLIELKEQLSGDKLVVLNSILLQFAP